VSWNYRVVEEANGLLGISETYYGDDGKPSLYTRHLPVQGETAQEVEEMHFAMAAALERPVLKEGVDFPIPEEKKRTNHRQLVKNVMRHPPPKRVRDQPFWSWVGMVFGLGSVSAFDLCQEVKFDPDTGEEYV
jgi:hypothetical protein